MNKKLAYKFLNELVEKYPNDAVFMLMDLIVDYFLFPTGDTPSATKAEIIELEKKLEGIKSSPYFGNGVASLKIVAIKEIREHLKCSLKEAKEFVEQRMDSEGKLILTSAKINENLLKKQSEKSKLIIDKIRKDYRLEDERTS